MSGLRALGIDLAADPANTGAALLTLGSDGVAVEIVPGKITDDRLVDLVPDVDVVGVDAPLGWPDPFVAALVLHQQGDAWPAADDPIQQRRLLSKRLTDRFVKATTGLDPLPVAADRIAAVAMRCARLQTLWGEAWGRLKDRVGTGRLVETYPAAALKLWGLSHRRYKGRGFVDARAGLVESLIVAAPWLQLAEGEIRCRESDHCFDAVISGLVAVAARLGLTRLPTTEAEIEVASREGWIHLPTCSLEQFTDSIR